MVSIAAMHGRGLVRVNQRQKTMSALTAAFAECGHGGPAVVMADMREMLWDECSHLQKFHRKAGAHEPMRALADREPLVLSQTCFSTQ
jgi:hypothetical protein